MPIPFDIKPVLCYYEYQMVSKGFDVDMGTYDHQQVLKDYANGKITVEMAVGHILQHIEKLYDAQQTADSHRYKLQNCTANLEQTLTSLRKQINLDSKG